MANFDEAFKKTAGIEGGYSDHPLDNGGETYAGISRKFHPSWPGWDAIDGEKTRGGFSGIDSRLRESSILQHSVRMFYKNEFWDCFDLGKMQSQKIANEVYDTGINMSQNVVAKFLQRTINLLLGDSDRRLTVDGRVGIRTHNALAKVLLTGDNETVVLRIMNSLQCMHYVGIVEAHPGQRVFLRGWVLQRVK